MSRVINGVYSILESEPGATAHHWTSSNTQCQGHAVRSLGRLIVSNDVNAITRYSETFFSSYPFLGVAPVVRSAARPAS